MNWRAIAAGALGALMAGSSLAFAADLGDYPAPFVDGSTVNALFVVGATAATADVVGAINMAARLGGAPVTTSQVTTTSTAGTLNIDGEGRELSTKSTKIYLDDDMGKTGLRTTLTDDDMPTLLKDGTVEDNNGTSYKYQQFIDLTPGTGGTAANYDLQFDRPGTASTSDGAYNFGRFPTSPSSTDYFFRERVVFGTNLLVTDAIGAKLELFGGDYTISSGSDLSANKLVLFGGSETHVLSGGESVTVTIEGTAYTVTLVGTSDADTAVLKVGSDQKSIDENVARKVGGLDVFVSDVFHLSTTDQTQNSAKVILGASKLTMTDGSKIKLGDNEDPVDGTSVALTRASDNERLSQLTVYLGGRSSSEDFLKAGESYLDPAWGSFNVAFVGVDPAAANGNELSFSPSGDNLIEMTWTDDNSKQATVNWAYKSSSTGTAFSLAGSSGNNIIVQERAAIGRDEYLVLDAGDFPHLFRVTDVDLDGSTSASIQLQDVFSGESVKITTGSDNQEAAVIDGQTYNFFNNSATNFTVTWGNNSNISSTGNGAGTTLTIYPKLKGKNGEYLAFFKNETVSNINTNSKIALPTGTIEFNFWSYGGTMGHMLNITAINNEDGTSSAFGASDTVTNINLSANTTATFTLGRTANAGIRYQTRFIDGEQASSTNSSVIAVVGESGAVPLAQPGVILIEEKDDAGDVKAVYVTASTETSGSNNVAIPSAPTFIGGEDSQSRGTDSTITDYVDLWGTYATRTTSGQDTVKIWYPDDQVIAHMAVLKKGATGTISTGGTAGSVTTQTITPIKTSIAKLDTEVTDADKNTKNLILVGGPAVNTLVAELGDAGKTWTLEQYRDAGEGTAIVHAIDDAFASGRTALIVAGHSAGDTGDVTSIMQSYDSYAADLAGRAGVQVDSGAITGELVV